MKISKIHLLSARQALLAASIVFLCAPARAENSAAVRVAEGGIKFSVGTNISAVSVHGGSNAMTATVTLHHQSGQIRLENLRAAVAPESFTTGMSLRDHHMRKKIFALEDSTMPPLEFKSDNVICPHTPSGQETVCAVSGELALRGVRRPHSFSLKVRNEGKAYRISAESVLSLTAFGIERPCQLGVCVSDDVKLKLDFRANESVELRAGAVR
jgi:polyisoprenoid-binding protein YceI